MSWKRGNDHGNETDDENFDEEELLGDGFSGEGEDFIEEDDDHSSLLDDDGGDITYRQPEFHSEVNEDLVDTGQPVGHDDEELLGDVNEEGDVAEEAGTGVGTLDTQINDDEYVEFSEASNEAEDVPLEQKTAPKVADAYTKQYKAPRFQMRSSDQRRFRGDPSRGNMQRFPQRFVHSAQPRQFLNRYGPGQPVRDRRFSRPNVPLAQYNQPSLMNQFFPNQPPPVLGNLPNQMPPQIANTVFQNIPPSLRMRGPPLVRNQRPANPHIQSPASNEMFFHGGGPMPHPFIPNNPVRFAPRNPPKNLLNLQFDPPFRPASFQQQNIRQPQHIQQQNRAQRQPEHGLKSVAFRQQSQSSSLQQQPPTTLPPQQQQVRPLIATSPIRPLQDRSKPANDRTASSKAVSSDSKMDQSQNNLPKEQSALFVTSSNVPEPATSLPLEIEYNHGLSMNRKRPSDGNEDVPRKRALLPSPNATDEKYAKMLEQQAKARERIRSEKEKRRLALAKSAAQKQRLHSQEDSQLHVATALVKPQPSHQQTKSHSLKPSSSDLHRNSRQQFTQRPNTHQQSIEKPSISHQDAHKFEKVQQNTVQKGSQEQNYAQSNFSNAPCHMQQQKPNVIHGQNAPQHFQRTLGQSTQQHSQRQNVQKRHLQENDVTPKSAPVPQMNYSQPPGFAQQQGMQNFHSAPSGQFGNRSNRLMQAGASSVNSSQVQPQQMSNLVTSSQQQVGGPLQNSQYVLLASSGATLSSHTPHANMPNQNTAMHQSSQSAVTNTQQKNPMLQVGSEQYLPSHQQVQSSQINVSQHASLMALSQLHNTQQSVDPNSQAQMFSPQFVSNPQLHTQHSQSQHFAPPSSTYSHNQQPTPPPELCSEHEQYNASTHELQVQPSEQMEFQSDLLHQTTDHETLTFNRQYATTGYQEMAQSASQTLPIQTSQQPASLPKKQAEVSAHQTSKARGAGQEPKVKYRIHPLDMLSNDAELAKTTQRQNSGAKGDADDYVLNTSAEYAQEASPSKQTVSISAHINPRHLKRIKDFDGAVPVHVNASKQAVVKCSTLNERFKQHHTEKRLKMSKLPQSSQTSKVETKKPPAVTSTAGVRRRQSIAKEMAVRGRVQSAVQSSQRVSPKASIQRTIRRSLTPASSVSSASSHTQESLPFSAENQRAPMVNEVLCCKILNLDRSVPMAMIRQMGEEVAVVNKVGRLKKNPDIVIITFAEDNHAVAFKRQYHNAEVMGSRIRVEFVAPKSSSSSKS